MPETARTSPKAPAPGTSKEPTRSPRFEEFEAIERKSFAAAMQKARAELERQGKLPEAKQAAE